MSQLQLQTGTIICYKTLNGKLAKGVVLLPPCDGEYIVITTLDRNNPLRKSPSFSCLPIQYTTDSENLPRQYYASSDIIQIPGKKAKNVCGSLSLENCRKVLKFITEQKHNSLKFEQDDPLLVALSEQLTEIERLMPMQQDQHVKTYKEYIEEMAKTAAEKERRERRQAKKVKRREAKNPSVSISA